MDAKELIRMKAIVGGRILLPEGEVIGKALLFDEVIRGVVDEKDVHADEVIDAQGAYVAPGFVDVHIHGYQGEDASDASQEGLRRMARALLENGVTSFLTTTMTVDWATLEACFQDIRELMQESAAADFDGAQILGCHAEGPFINPQRKGAQAAEAILPPDAAKVLPYRDVIRVITYAPEMPGADAFAMSVTAQSDIRLSIGHTGATYDQAVHAVRMGASRVTHTFNAMTGLHHRDPGVVGAALTEPVYCELIADTFHVHPGLFSMLHATKGDQLVLITDCTRAGGLADGEYTLGGQPIFVKGIECRLQDGTIAGSVLKMNDAVRNFRDHAGVTMAQAVRAASLNAAASAGLAEHKGSLENGKDADIVLMDDACRVQRTFVRSVCKWQQK